MSGGFFDYNQYKIYAIAESIERIIEDSGRLKTKEEIDRYSNDLYHYKYPDEVIEKLKLAIHHLKVAEIYAQRVDYLLSGDDGEESFLRRLKEDLHEYEKTKNHSVQL